MKKISEPIVFFGSGPVAAKSLTLLLEKFDVEAVVTKPRATHHKGSVPVLEVAAEHRLKVFTATNKTDLNKLFQPKPSASRLAILIDFGIIVSQEVIDSFPLGIVNSHFSLLPEWRGADPITFAILSGQKTTGVSLMLLTAGMDEGPLLAQTKADISPDMTTPKLTEVLIKQSHEALCNIIPKYVAGDIAPTPQTKATLAGTRTPTYSRRLTKNDGIIDWHKPAIQIEREIRAFAGWPQSKTVFDGLAVTITKARVLDMQGAPGVRTVVDKTPVVFCGTGALAIDGIKPAGKKEMPGRAFLAGYKTVFARS